MSGKWEVLARALQENTADYRNGVVTQRYQDVPTAGQKTTPVPVKAGGNSPSQVIADALVQFTEKELGVLAEMVVMIRAWRRIAIDVA